MLPKCFLDTNIFVYAYDARDREKQDTAKALVREMAMSRKGVVSYQVVQEFLNVVLGKAKQTMRHDDAQRYLITVFHPMLAVQSSTDLMSAAIRLQGKHKLSWYDSLIVAAAQRAECDVLYTEDLQNGQRFGSVVVENPFPQVIR